MFHLATVLCLYVMLPIYWFFAIHYAEARHGRGQLSSVSMINRYLRIFDLIGPIDPNIRIQLYASSPQSIQKKRNWKNSLQEKGASAFIPVDIYLAKKCVCDLVVILYSKCPCTIVFRSWTRHLCRCRSFFSMLFAAFSCTSTPFDIFSGRFGSKSLLP
jgi:hypothetical protein